MYIQNVQIISGILYRLIRNCDFAQLGSIMLQELLSGIPIYITYIITNRIYL